MTASPMKHSVGDLSGSQELPLSQMRSSNRQCEICQRKWFWPPPRVIKCGSFTVKLLIVELSVLYLILNHHHFNNEFWAESRRNRIICSLWAPSAARPPKFWKLIEVLFKRERPLNSESGESSICMATTELSFFFSSFETITRTSLTEQNGQPCVF